MRKQTLDSAPNSKRPLSGNVVGAISGSVGQFQCVVFFLHYALNWGGPFFRQDEGVSLLSILFSPLNWLFFLVFAVLGAVAGAMGGTTRRIVRGAAFSGLMSGLFWLTLLVVPVNLMIGLSGGGMTDSPTDTHELTIALVAAIGVGAIAGSNGCDCQKEISAEALTQFKASA